jgi:hypothetical protein
MIHVHPKHLLVFGFLLVVFGFLAPLLMVGHVIETSFFLGFVSYGASVAGLLLGMLGAASYSRANKD